MDSFLRTGGRSASVSMEVYSCIFLNARVLFHFPGNLKFLFGDLESFEPFQSSVVLNVFKRRF